MYIYNFDKMRTLNTLFLLLAVCAFPFLAHGEKGSKPKNILFIISDDLSSKALRCYGNKEVLTPNLDKLASEGVLFEKAYCQFPVCGAARASLMSGQYAPSIGVMGNGGSSKFTQNLGSHLTWSQLYKNNGYYSARVSKIYHMRVPGDITAGVSGPDHGPSWTEFFNCQGPEWMSDGRREHLTNERLKFDKNGHYNLGFGSAFYVVEGSTNGLEQPDVKAVNKAIEIMRRHSVDPFFLAVGFVRPHVPLVAPAEFFKPYDNQELTVAEVPKDDWDDIPKVGISLNSKKNGLFQNPSKKQKVLEAYYASVSFMDAQVGRLLQALDLLKLRDDTLVIFTSDHGYHLGEHDLWQKVSLHEESVQVPLIMSGPGVIQNVRNSSLIQHIDLYPTVARMSGLKVPVGCQGSDVRLAIKENQHIDRPFIHSCTGRGHLLRSEKYAFIKYNDGSLELYDMELDPKQFRNLAKNPDSKSKLIIKNFNKQLENFLKEIM